MNDLYKQCYKAFRADEHEHNGKGHIYVSVNSTIQRLNELQIQTDSNFWEPADWSFQSKHFTTAISPTQTRNGKDQYDAFCVGELTIPGLGTRMGTGADTNADLDTASKSSQAYALRKAGNQFGIAHYLLMNPKEEDALVKHLVASDEDDVAAMQLGVTMLMDIRKIDVSAANIVSTFGVTLDDLKTDSEVWLKILKGENRI